jgi:3-oxoadipate enol-lactonase
VLVCSSAQHDIQSRSLMKLWIRLREEIADDLVFDEVICLCAMGPDPLAQFSLQDAAETWRKKNRPQRGPAFIRNVEATLNNDTFAQLGQITAPTLVIYSDCDRVFPRKHGEHLAAAIPGARGILMEHCGHAPMAERPAEFIRTVRPFLLS